METLHQTLNLIAVVADSAAHSRLSFVFARHALIVLPLHPSPPLYSLLVQGKIFLVGEGIS